MPLLFLFCERKKPLGVERLFVIQILLFVIDGVVILERQLRPVLLSRRSVARQVLIELGVVESVVLAEELDCLLEHLISSCCGKSADCAVECGGDEAIGGRELRQGAIAEDGKHCACSRREQRKPLLGNARPLDQRGDDVADDDDQWVKHCDILLFQLLDSI